ncbi:hypothetical protein ABZ766_34085, partial [Streptomyces sp. NPDC006670]
MVPLRGARLPAPPFARSPGLRPGPPGGSAPRPPRLKRRRQIFPAAKKTISAALPATYAVELLQHAWL